ncbi:hypothetical protein CR513_63007, partial [Mucuna pruriens]
MNLPNYIQTKAHFIPMKEHTKYLLGNCYTSPGKCLASVTKVVNSDLSDDENKQILHYSVDVKLDVVKWNPLNQHQIICASKELNRLLAYDVHHRQLHPSI